MIDGRFLGTLTIANHCTIFRGIFPNPSGLYKIAILGIWRRNRPKSGVPSVQKPITKADPAKGSATSNNPAGSKTFKSQTNLQPKHQVSEHVACCPVPPHSRSRSPRPRGVDRSAPTVEPAARGSGSGPTDKGPFGSGLLGNSLRSV